MAFEDDFAIFVYQHDVWDALDFESFDWVVVEPLVVYDFIPFFSFDMVFEGDLIVIKTYADNTSFILPFLFVLH